MSKKPPIGPEYSDARQFSAILEDLRSEFRSFGEGLDNLQEKVSGISEKVEQLDQIKEDVTLIKMAVESLSRRVTTVESR